MNLPLKFLLLMWVGWVNRAQQNQIYYLKEENSILRERIGNKRLHLTNTQRRRLAEKAKVVGRKELRDLACIVTPDTLLRWHRGQAADLRTLSELDFPKLWAFFQDAYHKGTGSVWSSNPYFSPAY